MFLTFINWMLYREIRKRKDKATLNRRCDLFSRQEKSSVGYSPICNFNIKPEC